MTRTTTPLKSILIGLGILLVMVLIIAGVKGGQIGFMIEQGKSFTPPPETITSVTAQTQAWPSLFNAIGTVEAAEGIVISAEVAGKVKRIAFKSGEFVRAGEVVIEQESGNEEAQLSALSARLNLAHANFERLAQLKQKNTVSQSELDLARQQKESAQGDFDNLKTTLQKKILRAPFDGRLGIRQVDQGQDLQVGTPIVSLQASNRVRVNFPVPQAWLVQLKKGMAVTLDLGKGPEQHIKTSISAIGAEINPVTRNATVQASLDNSDNQLIPGMAVKVEVSLSEPREVLAVPVTAIVYAPYGDTVYVIEPGEQAGSLKARQQFIRAGEQRGDFVEVLDGIKAGQKVVAAGAFKLFNGQAVVEGPNPAPDYKLTPKPADN
ncbi:MAG: efflux RND transporter periplasmic adaptor subunit [Moraxellaceae bacterium]|nr:MAG: efflux RND transporter periplasmic adaptor subunit [Moraxellaceae bacterium]